MVRRAATPRVSNHEATGFEQELRGIYHASAGKLSGFRCVWPSLSASLQNWFEAQLDCS